MQKISLIFPVYNVALCVKESLLSALNQSYECIEYIIVDDKGSDNSMEIVLKVVNEHRRKDAVKIVVHQENRGHGGAANTGIDNATGDYVFFLDSDDTLAPKAIECLVDLETSNYDVVVGSYIRTTSRCTNSVILSDSQFQTKLEIINAYFKDKSYYDPIWGKLYNLNFLTKNNLRLIENCNHEDPPFTFEVTLSAKNIRVSSVVIYNWVFRDGSTTSVYKEKNLLHLLFGYHRMLKITKSLDNEIYYITLLSHINNFRLFPVWLLLKNKVLSDRKNELLREFTAPILTMKEIVSLRLSLIERMKHLLCLLPFSFRKLVFKLISNTQNV